MQWDEMKCLVWWDLDMESLEWSGEVFVFSGFLVHPLKVRSRGSVAGKAIKGHTKLGTALG